MTSPVTPRSTATADTVTPIRIGTAIGHDGQFHFFAPESEAPGNDLDRLVSAVTTIAQSQCEQCENYADIETLVCYLPLDQWAFAAHDSLAPYSGPYSMTILIRAFIVETLNGWDETALHDYLHAKPSLRRDLGFETLPAQSTFWRAWHHRFSEKLRDAVQECADAIVRAARTCDVTDRYNPDLLARKFHRLPRLNLFRFDL